MNKRLVMMIRYSQNHNGSKSEQPKTKIFERLRIQQKRPTKLLNFNYFRIFSNKVTKDSKETHKELVKLPINKENKIEKGFSCIPFKPFVLYTNHASYFSIYLKKCNLLPIVKLHQLFRYYIELLFKLQTNQNFPRRHAISLVGIEGITKVVCNLLGNKQFLSFPIVGQ